MNTRKVLMGVGIAVLAVLMLVAVGLVVSTLLPKKAQPKVSLSPIVVNINLPLNGAKLPLNEVVSVYAEAIGPSSVHDLELWVDGAFSPTKMDSSPLDRSPLTAVWQWIPSTEGVHRLIIRAIGPDGSAVNSNVVRVSVLPREQIAALQVATVAPQEMPRATEMTGGLAESIDLPEGGAASGEPPPSPPAPPPPTPPAQPQDPAPGPAGTPSLEGTINGCDANLLIQDNSDDEDGFYLYRLDPTSTGFQNVATLDKHAGQGAFAYIDPGLETGAHTYYVASYKGGVESASNLVNLNVPQGQCQAPLAFGLQDALLTTTKSVDKVYCYLSVNGGPWERIPPGMDTFIYPSAAGFDLSDYLDNLISPPPAGGVTLELECWGWSGNTLVYLGYLKKEIAAGPVDLEAIDLELIGNAINIEVPETDPYNLSPLIAPPHDLQFAADLADCFTHAQGLVSDALCNSMTEGDTVLTWHWSSGCPILKQGEQCPYTIADIDGFHIYRLVPGSDPGLIHDVQYPQAQVAEITPSTGAMLQPQYYIRAYKGTQESADSEHIFGVAPPSSVTFTNYNLWILRGEMRRYDGTFCSDTYGPVYDKYGAGHDSMHVGFTYYGHKDSSTCYRWQSTFYDGHIVFPDISTTIKGNVIGAVLHFVQNPEFLAGYGVDGWNSYRCWIPLSDYEGNLIADYPLDGTIGYDVTTPVRAWAQGLPNQGFILWAGWRNLAAYDNQLCTATFSNFALDVTYAPATP
jgi:hypothetical protein